MIVMPGNNADGLVHYLAGKYPKSVGWLLSPSAGFKEPREWLPYAIDNGKFSVWSNDAVWSESQFIDLLDRCRLSRYKPLWIAAPDEVADREATLILWNEWEQRLRDYGWPLAFVVQDGMTPNDVPDSAEVVFIGGTSEWKWRYAELFCDSFPRVHIGRVGTTAKLEYCESIGVESCDGTGFFCAPDRTNEFRRFIEGHRSKQLQLTLDSEPELKHKV